MKSVFVSMLIIFSATFANTQIPGNKIAGPIKINDTLSVKEGDVLKLGAGSSGNFGNFRYVYAPDNYLLGTPEESLPRSYSGATITIKFFKEYTHKKQGTKLYTVVNLGGLNEVVELLPAIESGEIVSINGKPVGKIVQTSATIIQQKPSAADELAKWKKLFDDGVITKEEYEAKKKKILEEN